MLARGQAETEASARHKLAVALLQHVGRAAGEVAAGAESVHTDYPEHGVSVRVFRSHTPAAPREAEATTASAVSRSINAAGMGDLCSRPPALDPKTGSILVLLNSTEGVATVGAELRRRRYRVWTPGPAAMRSRMSGYIRVLGRFPQ